MNISKKLFSILMTFAMIVNMFTGTVTIHAEETNLLSGKSYVTYEGAKNSPASALDGNVDTYWDEDWENSPWVTVDLGGKYLIDTVNVVNYWSAGDGRYYHYDVYVSEDGENFQKVVEKRTNDAATVEGDTFEIDPVYATHVKFEAVYHSANGGFHFNELAVYGTAVEEEKTNLLSGKDYSVHEGATGYPERALDGDVNSYWDQDWVNSPWITVDLDGMYLVDTVNVVNY